MISKHTRSSEGQNDHVRRMRIRGVSWQTICFTYFDLYVCQEPLGYKCDSAVICSVSLVLTFCKVILKSTNPWQGQSPDKHNLDQFDL